MQTPDIAYYDHTNDRPINVSSDGCNLAEWSQNYPTARFARHPKGFLIFLPPDKITGCDEYSEGDPHQVAERIDSPFQKRRIETTLGLLREALPKNGENAHILDMGCGEGHLTVRMAETFPEAKIAALDYSVSAVAYAHTHFPAISFIVSDAYDSPYPRGRFDVVICNNIWEHVPDPLFLLKRIRLLLKPNGWLVISTPSRYRLGNLLRILQGKKVDFLSDHHVTEYTVGQVQEQLRFGGFKTTKATSPAISTDSLKGALCHGLFSAFLKIVGSHHQLEATVFYLAQKQPSPNEKS